MFMITMTYAPSAAAWDARSEAAGDAGHRRGPRADVLVIMNTSTQVSFPVKCQYRGEFPEIRIYSLSAGQSGKCRLRF